MLVDTSAMIALIQGEPQASDIASTIASSAARIAAPSATECMIVLSHRYGPVGRTLYERVRQEFGVPTVAFTEAHTVVAHRAYVEFGKGRHPAALNFGDCMTYAVARLANESLLCVGDDFPQTDLVFDGLIGSWPEKA
ncbi:MAG: type II toxin-antitoxin system VapC family toxin [Mycobacterium sp.]